MAGIGPGNPKFLTMEAREAIENFEKVVAFGRVADTLKNIRKDLLSIEKVIHIDRLIDKYENILILASGDPCFYGIVEYLKKKNIAIKQIMPGISSFQYMMARLGISWQGANLLSLHGREGDLKTVKNFKLSVIFTDNKNTPASISKKLGELGVKGTMYIGFNLSYDDEQIIKIKIGEYIDNISSLSVVVVQNEMD